MVQIPRIYPIHRKANIVHNFEEFLENIFQPLFEVAINPQSHPDLADVLPSISSIDSVDDESIQDPLTARRSQVYGDVAVGSEAQGDVLRPQLWNVEENPPYSYYSFYMFANLRRFNALCKLLGRPWHLTFRPHCGEAGASHHLATGFLLADGINHGINLQHTPTLQYLYAITQIGISVSPLSNDALFVHISNSPFADFFHRGLNVTLSTDDPLMFHTTNEPLLEEYITAKHVFRLSSTDLCEIAANSVRQSGFPPQVCKAAGVSRLSAYDWDPVLCNVPARRIAFRKRSLAEELRFLRFGASSTFASAEGDAAEVDWTKVDL